MNELKNDGTTERETLWEEGGEREGVREREGERERERGCKREGEREKEKSKYMKPLSHSHTSFCQLALWENFVDCVGSACTMRPLPSSSTVAAARHGARCGTALEIGVCGCG